MRAIVVAAAAVAALGLGHAKKPLPPQTLPSQPTIPMSWSNAGAIIRNTIDVDPTWLGQTLRTAGFGWVAVYLGEEDEPYVPDPDWITRFRAASGLPVGGWSTLGVLPQKDAGIATHLVVRYGLAFYIADAEWTYQDVRSRARAFISIFRRDLHDIPAGLSSFCDANGLDLGTWAKARFVFLPQAYVNDFGSSVAPSVCVNSAVAIFGKSNIHPTVGSYVGQLGVVPPARFAQLLAQAGTTGFSVFPAEVNMSAQDWQVYGQAIARQHIANRVR